MKSVATTLLIVACLTVGSLLFLRHAVGRRTDAAIQYFMIRLMEFEGGEYQDTCSPDLPSFYGGQELQRRGRMYRRLLGRAPPPIVEIVEEKEVQKESGEQVLEVKARLTFPKGTVDADFVLVMVETKGWRVSRFDVYVPEELQMPPNREMLERHAKRLGELWGANRADSMQQVMHPELLARIPLQDLQALLERDVETRGQFKQSQVLRIEDPEPRKAHVVFSMEYANATVEVFMDFSWEDSTWMLSDLGETS